jgi:hypothetical protein
MLVGLDLQTEHTFLRDDYDEVDLTGHLMVVSSDIKRVQNCPTAGRDILFEYLEEGHFPRWRICMPSNMRRYHPGHRSAEPGK